MKTIFSRHDSLCPLFVSMAEGRVPLYSIPPARRPEAGIISKIRMENFMCHSNLEIELGDCVNFITGQNGSGKSAILTALRVAFGCRAKATERANTMKDFIKTGCSYALVRVEIKNHGDDAFRPDIYGAIIIVERRISESTSAITLKDCVGKKVATGRVDLQKIVEHFNIDVDNPCVIMSQDKSREFLNSGNSKDKFRFFYKATLLEQLSQLMNDIEMRVNQAAEHVGEMEKSLSPLLKEMDDIEAKIRSLEEVEGIAQQVQELRKKLAWSSVYDVDQQLQHQAKVVEKLKGRIPACQERIDKQKQKMDELHAQMAGKKAQIEDMMGRTSEARRMIEESRQALQQAVKEKIELEGDCQRESTSIQNVVERIKSLEQRIQYTQEQEAKNTQAEKCEMEQKLREIQNDMDGVYSIFKSLKEEEDSLLENMTAVEDEIRTIAVQIEENAKKNRDISFRIRELKQQQNNRVMAFGGQRVSRLLQVLKGQRQKFRRPPIGPIGSHVTLQSGDYWASSIENAIGWLLNSFIVTDHQDFLQLRACAREADYNNLRIIIYDFSRPSLNVPSHMLPQTNHPTVFSVLHSDNPTVMNVLIDSGGAERQALVKDYNAGKAVAFDRKVSNLKEVFTADGYKMFSRGSVQTVLPPNRNSRGAQRLGSFENQIKDLEREALHAEEQCEDSRGRKRKQEETRKSLKEKLVGAKRRRQDTERQLRAKEFELHVTEKSIIESASPAPTSTVDELHYEISKAREEIEARQTMLQKMQMTLNEVAEKASNLKASFENLRESAKEDIDSLEKAEKELRTIENKFQEAKSEKEHYDSVMSRKVLSGVKEAEGKHHELEQNREEICRKASMVCPESEIKALGGWCGSNPDQLSAKLTRLKDRLKRESQRCPESIDDLKLLHDKKRRKIKDSRTMYRAFQENLDACKGALALRRKKFQINADAVKQELQWKFNHFLSRKGISGSVALSYEEKTLSIEVNLPQDASKRGFTDTRGLSGGERSFSTLCFTLTLHQMTEAPFRAMDEFDVFMDAISRKISLDTLVDFALTQVSQWIFITPHDISMVKQDERIKKQQMAAPRG